MSKDAMIKCLLRAASLASNRWLVRRAVPGNVSSENASRSIKPRRTNLIRMILFQLPSIFTHFHLATYRDVITFRASLSNFISKQLLMSHGRVLATKSDRRAKWVTLPTWPDGRGRPRPSSQVGHRPRPWHETVE